MKYFERLGITPNYILPEKDIEVLNLSLKEPSDIKLIFACKGIAVDESTLLSSEYYYLENKNEAIKYGSLMIQCLKDYLFGNWRSRVPLDGGRIDSEGWKTVGWANYFRYGLMWSSCIKDWDSIKHLSQYPDDKCGQDSINSKQFYTWYLLIASILRGEPLPSLERYTDFLERSKKKKEKLLLQILYAILEKNRDEANVALLEYLKYYKQNEFPRPGIMEKISVDGTFLINYASHNGLSISYPQEYADHIVVL